MGALSFFTTIFASSESQVKATPERCLRNRLRGNRCDLCLQICPTGALTYANESLRYAEENCSNCMGCTAVCPVDAVAPSFDLQKFVDQARSLNHTTLTISCEYNRLFREDEILLPCLGAFSYELLVYIASGLTRKTVRFNARKCNDCRNEKISRWFQQNLNNVRKYIDATGTRLELLTSESNEQEQNDRRTFLKAMQRDVINVTTAFQDAKKEQQDATSRSISSKSILLKQILDSQTHHHPMAAKMVPQMHIGESCRPCPRCAGICPTGALKLVRLGNRKKVEFDGTSCSGCALCVNFCEKEALALSCIL